MSVKPLLQKIAISFQTVFTYTIHIRGHLWFDSNKTMVVECITTQKQFKSANSINENSLLYVELANSTLYGRVVQRQETIHLK